MEFVRVLTEAEVSLLQEESPTELVIAGVCDPSVGVVGLQGDLEK